MSEKAPRSTAAELLANFGENKDRYENGRKTLEERHASEGKYVKSFYGKAGSEKFEDKHAQRLDDIAAYEAHRAQTHENGPLDEEAELNMMINSDPRLRQADMIARNIAESRGTASDERVKELEDRLQELLVRYSEDENHKEGLIDAIINRTGEAPASAEENDQDSETDTDTEKGEDSKTTDDEKAPVDENDLLSQTGDVIKSVEDMTLKDILTNGKSAEENAKLIGDLQAALAKIQAELVGHEEATKKAKTLKNYGGGITALRDSEKNAHFVEDPEKAHDMANATVPRLEEELQNVHFIPNMDAAHADALAELTRVQDPFYAEQEARKQEALNNLTTTRVESEPKKKSTLGEKYLLWKYGDGSEKSEKEKSRRKKIFFAIGAAAVVGAAGIATFFAMKNGADHSAVAPSLDKHVGGGHEFIEPTPKAHHNVTELPTEHFTHDQLTVDPGEGWASQLLGADPTLTHHDIYSNILPELLKSKNPEVQKWVMELTNAQGNVEPGISQPGQMPEAVLKEALSYKNL